MKQLLFAFMLLPALCFGQTTKIESGQTDEKAAGIELQRAAQANTSGVVVQAAGIVVVAVGAGSKSESVIIAGGIISFVGWIIQQNAWSHIRKSGKALAPKSK